MTKRFKKIMVSRTIEQRLNQLYVIEDGVKLEGLPSPEGQQKFTKFVSDLEGIMKEIGMQTKLHLYPLFVSDNNHCRGLQLEFDWQDWSGQIEITNDVNSFEMLLVNHHRDSNLTSMSMSWKGQHIPGFMFQLLERMR